MNVDDDLHDHINFDDLNEVLATATGSGAYWAGYATSLAIDDKLIPTRDLFVLAGQCKNKAELTDAYNYWKTGLITQ